MIDYVAEPGRTFYSTAARFGELLCDQLAADPNFYFFSPDETTSNQLTPVYQAAARAWALPTRDWDLPEAQNGRIIELLSENTLFACLLGHVLSGEQGMMASYEAFYSVITSQLLQHIKFIDQSLATSWRPAYPAVNLLSTSTCWRQDHNGFSHQSPALISTLLNLPSRHVNCLFPVDDVSADAAMQFMLASRNVVNLTTFNKSEEPRWIDSHHATFQYDNGGASVFGFASDDLGDLSNYRAETPTFIFTAAGDIATREALYAMKILRQDLPGIQLRFIGINALSYHQIGTTEHPLAQSTFDEYFGSDAAALPIIANFHGYPDTFRTILSQYAHPARLSVHGFQDHGTTTTPFEMLSLNQASRYDLCIDVAQRLHRTDLLDKYRRILRVNHAYASEHGIDLPPLTDYHF